MKKYLPFFLIAALSLAANDANSQSGYMDNALNYNRLLIAKTPDGVYKLVGNFKVIGTSYLFGERNKGDIFSPETKAYNISLSYNTYKQEVEFYSTANPDKPLIKEPGTLDSFILRSDIDVDPANPQQFSGKFIYGPLLGSSEKSYFLELYAGKRFSVYKRYKADLGYVSSNYIQSELRQFDLLYDYFYIDKEKQGLKRLKTNASSIIKEFKDLKDISSVFTADGFSADQEAALRKAFEYLNQ
ncbi:MAG TPA: hypothetical protein VFV31_01675 [Chitinophagaceae bacterium]|nr:hypothetical protein [Chitinophagaceae bacterium]